MVLHKVHKPSNFIFDALSNMETFATLHPVVNKIEFISSEQYLFFESLKIGPFSFAFTYPASVHPIKAQQRIIMKAIIFGKIFLDVYFDISRENGFSLVREEIKISTWLPIRTAMKMIVVKHHKQLFANLENMCYA